MIHVTEFMTVMAVNRVQVFPEIRWYHGHRLMNVRPKHLLCLGLFIARNAFFIINTVTSALILTRLLYGGEGHRAYLSILRVLNNTGGN